MIQQREVPWLMHQRHPLVFGLARLDLRQLRSHATLFKPLHDGAKPVRRLRMAGAHIMFKVSVDRR